MSGTEGAGGSRALAPELGPGGRRPSNCYATRGFSQRFLMPRPHFRGHGWGGHGCGGPDGAIAAIDGVGLG